MEKNKFINRNLLNFVSLFGITIIVFYFFFPTDPFSEHVVTGAIITMIYHIPALIKFFKKDWSY